MLAKALPAGGRCCRAADAGEAEHAVERGADLVAHVGQELALHAGQPLGGEAGLLAGFFEGAPLGDVHEADHRADDAAVADHRVGGVDHRHRVAVGVPDLVGDGDDSPWRRVWLVGQSGE
jgi:hypothetical protein